MCIRDSPYRAYGNQRSIPFYLYFNCQVSDSCKSVEIAMLGLYFVCVSYRVFLSAKFFLWHLKSKNFSFQDVIKIRFLFFMILHKIYSGAQQKFQVIHIPYVTISKLIETIFLFLLFF